MDRDTEDRLIRESVRHGDRLDALERDRKVFTCHNRADSMLRIEYEFPGLRLWNRGQMLCWIASWDFDKFEEAIRHARSANKANTSPERRSGGGAEGDED